MHKGYHPQVVDSVSSSSQLDTNITKSNYEETLFADTVHTDATRPVQEKQELVYDSVVVTKPAKTVQVDARIQSPDPDTTRTDAFFRKEEGWNFNANFLAENALSERRFYKKKDSLNKTLTYGSIKDANSRPVERIRYQEDWLTGLAFLIMLLFIWIRIFFGKFFDLLFDSVANFKIAAKIYLEKNILTRRASLMFDFIYFMVFSAFLYEAAIQFQIAKPELTGLLLFGIILGILFFYSVIRIALLHLMGFIFKSKQIFTEYIHHTFVLNKGLGVLLFPLVVTAFYIAPEITKYILILGMVVYGIVFVFKIIRAYKIIIHKDVFLFYMILYLCTLEILPLLLGYKALKPLIINY